ncbi:MAG: hypothetical protein GX565_14245 [Lentisphaerae bacterium]|jgi:hypothetical protein|nr:hypothetical protein [Lentisphaerota bacterium]
MYDTSENHGLAALFVLAIFIFVIAYCRRIVGVAPADLPKPSAHAQTVMPHAGPAAAH